MTDINALNEAQRQLINQAAEVTNQVTDRTIATVRRLEAETMEVIKRAVSLYCEEIVVGIKSKSKCTFKHCEYLQGTPVIEISALENQLLGVTAGHERNLTVTSTQLKLRLANLEMAALGSHYQPPQGFITGQTICSDNNYLK